MNKLNVFITSHRFTKKIQALFSEDIFNFLLHSRNYLTASFFNQLLAIASVPIFTRLLTPADYGVLAVFSAFVAILNIFFSLSTQSALMRYYYDERSDFSSFLGSTLLFVIVWGVVFSMLLGIFRFQLISFLNVSVEVFYLAIASGFITLFYTFYDSFLQTIKKSAKTSKISIISNVSNLIFAVIIILILRDDKYFGKIYATLIVSSFVALYSFYSLKNHLKWNIKKEHIIYSLSFSLPVVLHLLFQNVLASFDQIIINQLVGPRETGLYSIGYNIGKLELTITLGLLTAITPVFYEKLKNKKYQDIENLVSIYAKIVFLVALVLILFSKEAVILLTTSQYHEALDIIPIVVISYVFMFFYFLYVNYAFYYKKTISIAIFTIISGSINIGLNYLLIPKYGYKVAAWNTMFSYASLFILHYLNVKFIMKIENTIKLRTVIFNFFVLIFCILIFILVMNVVEQYIWILSIKVALIIFLAYIYFHKAVNKILKHES